MSHNHPQQRLVVGGTCVDAKTGIQLCSVVLAMFCPPRGGGEQKDKSSLCEEEDTENEEQEDNSSTRAAIWCIA